VARSGCFVLGALLASASSSCLLYTDHINHSPEVKVTGDVKVPWGFERPARYHAEGNDADQTAQTLVYEWRRDVGECPTKLADAQMGPVLGNEADFEIDVDLPDEYCVWVVVHDADKAAAFASLSTAVTHKDLEAVIDVVKPKGLAGDHFPLYSTVQLSGARSMDPEQTGELTVSWVGHHNGGVFGPIPCPQGPTGDVCLTPEEPGEYQIELSVKNVRGLEAKATKTLFIEADAPPCIRLTQPTFGLPRSVVEASEILSFKVRSVEDDGDPYPPPLGRPSTARFTATWWFEGEDSNNPSGRRPADQALIPELTFGRDYFHAGDQVYVRIQVEDRVNRDFTACAKDKVENCALGKDPTCYQWVTWKLDVLLGRDR
jgi:hypothetical protein